MDALASPPLRKYLEKMIRISLILILFASCNPVKKVLNDRTMFDKVAKEVIKAGLCANDTTIITKSDTTIKVDTLTIVDEQLEVKVFNDTTYITKWRTNVVTKTLTIHDTIKAVVVDNARVNILQAELTSAKVEVENWKGKANKAFAWLIIVLMGIAAYLYIKLKK